MRRSKGRLTAWVLMAIVLVVAGSVIAEVAMLPDPNPSGRHEGPILSRQSDEVLRRACFDCHSNETRWPWYSYVPPVSVLIVRDVSGARGHVNFSEWNGRPEQKQAKDMQKALDEIRAGRMPLPRYLWLHPDAVVSETELAALTEDVRRSYGEEFTQKPPEGEEHGHKDDE